MSTWKFRGGEIEIEKASPPEHSYKVVRGPRTGQEAAGVTTIASCLSVPGDGLKYWAVNSCIKQLSSNIEPGLAYDKEYLSGLFQRSRHAFKLESKQAMAIGTTVHRWIESFSSKNLPSEPMPTDPLARKACLGFVRWAESVNLRPLSQESVLYSPVNHYAGTMDMLAYVRGALTVLDFKVSRKVYPSAKLQITAYASALMEEASYRKQKIEFARCILRLCKDTGEAYPLYLPSSSMEEDLSGFLACLQAYRWLKRQEKPS